MITPWNWPINQITCKVCPAIAAGCTMVLKPSEIAPMDAIIFAEIMHDAGVPKGVFNLVNGDGPGVGTALSEHPDIDMISFTGSARAGVLIAKAAADTIKRVQSGTWRQIREHLLDDVDIDAAVTRGVLNCFSNSGQSCNAPTRMFVPEQANGKAIDAARLAAESIKVGPPTAEGTQMGPVVSEVQFKKIQDLIQAVSMRVPRWWPRDRAAGRLEPRLLRAADRVRRCDARYADCQRRNLWPGAFDLEISFR